MLRLSTKHLVGLLFLGGCMSLKIKSIRIAERDELEPIIIENPDVIEEGIKIVSHQQLTDTGPLDILAVDSSGTLIVMELKNEASDVHLDQGVRYYDWCRKNLGWIASAFKEFKINEKAFPRLFLVAPSYTENVTRIVKYLSIDVSLFEYHAVEDEKGNRGVICTALDFGPPQELPQITTIEDKLGYISDEKVKELFKSILDELNQKGFEVKPVSGLDITIWYKGKRFMYVSPRKKHFVVNVLSSEGTWSGQEQVTTRKYWDEYWNTSVKPYLDYLDTNRLQATQPAA